jgi:hypothetical protein
MLLLQTRLLGFWIRPKIEPDRSAEAAGICLSRGVIRGRPYNLYTRRYARGSCARASPFTRADRRWGFLRSKLPQEGDPLCIFQGAKWQSSHSALSSAELLFDSVHSVLGFLVPYAPRSKALGGRRWPSGCPNRAVASYSTQSCKHSQLC